MEPKQRRNPPAPAYPPHSSGIVSCLALGVQHAQLPSLIPPGLLQNPGAPGWVTPGHVSTATPGGCILVQSVGL